MTTFLRSPGAVARLGYASFVTIGWSGLLVPSVIRQIEAHFSQTDAGLGVFYFVYSLLYATGSLGGGFAIERLGRRTVLGAAALLHAAGLASLATVPTWELFLLAAVPAGLGAGAIDGGVNGLFMDAYRTERGRALNLLHLFFALGALIAPFVVGRLVEGGAGWQAIVLATAAVLVPLAAGFAGADLPHGRHDRGATNRPRLTLGRPLLLLAVAATTYVASEVGVSNWLVRFLEDAPLAVATGALSLLWGGLTVGRLVASRFGDRFDHVRFAIAAAAVSAVALVAAIVVEPVELRVVLFTIVGFAFGPIYPMIMASAGDRFPDRSAAVSGVLGACAIGGSIVYPPVMGFLSVTVGLQVAMFGAAGLAAVTGVALALLGARRAASPGRG
jgi:fucose permease